MTILVTDGLSFNENKEYKDFSKTYVCGCDSSNPNELCKIMKLINDKVPTKTEEILATLFHIATDNYIPVNEEISITFLLEQRNIEKIKQLQNEQVLKIPKSYYLCFLPYKVQNKITPETNSEIPMNLPESANMEESSNNIGSVNTDKSISAKSPRNAKRKFAFDRKRIKEIKELVGDTKLKWSSRRIPEEILNILENIIYNDNNYTNAEIASATKLNPQFIANIRSKFKKQKENINDSTPTVTNVKTKGKDATDTAKKERKKELENIVQQFDCQYDESGKMLTHESHEQFKKLFVNPNRNWKVNEIVETTGLKKSLVEKLLTTEPTKELSKDENASIASIVSKEAEAYKSKMNYDISLAQNEPGIFLTGNIIQDSANALGIDKFKKQDEDCLAVAFGCLSSFDTDFYNTLSKCEFTYLNDIEKLRPICRIFRQIRFQQNTNHKK